MDLSSLSEIPLEEIYSAQQYTTGKLLRTPLVPLNYKTDGKQIYLKLENLQVTGSFKVRGALNALRSLSEQQTAGGVWTCSAGNFAQGLCQAALIRDVTCRVVVPDTAPSTKVAAIKELGGIVTEVPYDTWWQVMMSRQYEGMTGQFIHPVCDPMVIAGHGVMGLEILEQCSDVDTIIGPVGGGGHLSGIASAVKQLKPDVKVIACEVEGAAPLTASRAANKPVTLTSHQTTFVDGMGGKSVFPDMWQLLSHVIDSTVVLGVGEICAALQLLLAKNKVLAEGAGAATVAAALRGANMAGDSAAGVTGDCRAGGENIVQGKNIVCVISGGNIDMETLQVILQGKIP